MEKYQRGRVSEGPSIRGRVLERQRGKDQRREIGVSGDV